MDTTIAFQDKRPFNKHSYYARFWRCKHKEDKILCPPRQTNWEERRVNYSPLLKLGHMGVANLQRECRGQ